MKGIIGKKIGMTSFFDADGNQIPCTVVEAGPCYVTQIKTNETDGYEAVQLGFSEAKPKRVNQAQQGHFKRSGVKPQRKLVEFRDFEIYDEEGETVSVNAGDTISVDVFEEGEYVNVVGTSKGKGFQGVVKRHNFRGVGMATHGQHNRLRAPGSIGAASYPARVFKGMRMAGRTGGERVKVRNLVIAKVLADKNIVLIKGAIPGPKGGYVTIEAQ